MIAPIRKLMQTATARMGCLLLCSLFSACSSTPVQNVRHSDWALSAGARTHEHLVDRFGLYQDKRLHTYIKRIGNRLTDHLPYRFTFYMLDTDQVHAYAAPNGNIYLSRGLIAYLDSEDELAAIMAHEIAHVLGKHAENAQLEREQRYRLGMSINQRAGLPHVQDLSQGFTHALSSAYSREQELSADYQARQYLLHAKYNPSAMLSALRMLDAYEDYTPTLPWAGTDSDYDRLYATHPDTDERIRRLEKQLSAYKPVDPSRRSQYLHAIEGMRMGAAAPIGVIDGRRIRVGKPAVALRLPAGWGAQYRGDALYAGHPDKAWKLILTTRHISPVRSARATYLKYHSEKIQHGRSIHHKGLNGYSALHDIKTDSRSVRYRRIMIYTSTHALIIRATTVAGDYPRDLDRALNIILNSLRPLFAHEQPRLQPLKLIIRAASPRDDYRNLAADARGFSDAKIVLRIMNRDPKHKLAPAAGRLIKAIR